MIKQNNRTRSALFLAIAVLITAALTSCNQGIVSPLASDSFDSARYSWVMDTIPDPYIDNGWYYDSNNVFLLGDGMMKYDGNNFTHYYYPFLFGAFCITGFDGNNVYIGGYHPGPNSDRAALVKWTGSSFIRYTLPDTDKSESFGKVYCRNPNEIWLSSSSDKIYMFDGTVFHPYSIDTNYSYIDPFMIDASNNLYFMGRVYYGTTTVDSSLVELHKFNNSSWEKIYSEMLYGGGTYFVTQNIGTEICALAAQDILKFNGAGFVPAMKIKAFLPYGAAVTGPSFSNFSCSGYDYSSRYDYIFNWKVNKWSKEVITRESATTKIIYSDEQKIYAIMYDYLANTIFIKGRRK